MLTSALLTDVYRLKTDLASAKPFLDGIQKLAEAYDSLYPYVAGTAEGGAKINEFASHLHNTVSGIRSILDGIPVHEFFRSVDSASHAFVSFMEGESHVRTGAQTIAVRIGAFSGLFDQFVRIQTPKNAMPVLREAHALKIELDAFLRGLHAAVDGFAWDLGSAEDSIVLTLLGEYSIAAIAEKLAALHAICLQIEYVLEDSGEDANFRVLRIETGSISLSLAAGALAIAMLRRFIVSAVQFSYRNFTREGKLRYGVIDEMKALEELIKLRVKLDKAGINTDEMNKRLESAGSAIAQNLAVLLFKENHVQIDGDDYENPPDEGAIRISARSSKQLPGRTANLLGTDDV